MHIAMQLNIQHTSISIILSILLDEGKNWRFWQIVNYSPKDSYTENVFGIILFAKFFQADITCI